MFGCLWYSSSTTYAANNNSNKENTNHGIHVCSRVIVGFTKQQIADNAH